MTRYEIDTEIRLTVNFTLVADNSPVDPVEVILRVQPPAGAEVQYALGAGQVLRDDVGVYHCDLLTGQVGRWSYKWQGQGGVEVTTPDTRFVVNYTTFADLRL
jgi:hypothetical protein